MLRMYLGLVLLFIVMNTIAITEISRNLRDNIKHETYNLLQEARTVFQHQIAMRQWNASHGGVFVVPKKGEQPNPYLKENHTYTQDGVLLMKVNPAWMTRQFADATHTPELFFRVTSLDPLNPSNTPNDFEREALKEMTQKNAVEYYRLDEDKLNYMGALITTKECLSCHAHQGYRLGDIRGGISVYIDLKTFSHRIEAFNSYFHTLALIVVGFLSAVFVLFGLLHRSRAKLKAHNHALSLLQQKYEHTIASAQEGLIEYDLLTHRVHLSDSWKIMLGYPPTLSISDLNETQSFIHPDDLPVMQAHVDYLLTHAHATKETVARMRHADGSWRWTLNRGMTTMDEKHAIIGFNGLQLDITQYHELKLELQAKEQEFALFMNHVPASIMIRNASFGVIYRNSYLTPLLDTLGTAFTRALDAMQVALKESSHHEDIVTLPDTQDRDMILRVIIFRIELGAKEAHFGFIIVDITQGYLLSQALHEKDEMLIAQSRYAAMGEMIGMIAHQWRQPIAVIAMGANNMLADIALQNFEAASFEVQLQELLAQTQHLSKTIDDFRNYFRPNKHQSCLYIQEVVQESLHVIESSLSAHGIELITAFSPTRKTFIYDKDLLQVLLNILHNAKEALEKAPNPRRMTVSVSAHKNTIMIELSNNGGHIGAVMDKIFDPYFTTKQEQNGTGLGLYMCKTIIESHLLGTITAKDLNENEVSFTITLPLEPCDD